MSGAHSSFGRRGRHQRAINASSCSGRTPSQPSSNASRIEGTPCDSRLQWSDRVRGNQRGGLTAIACDGVGHLPHAVGTASFKTPLSWRCKRGAASRLIAAAIESRGNGGRSANQANPNDPPPRLSRAGRSRGPRAARPQWHARSPAGRRADRIVDESVVDGIGVPGSPIPMLIVVRQEQHRWPALTATWQACNDVGSVRWCEPRRGFECDACAGTRDRSRAPNRRATVVDATSTGIVRRRCQPAR